MTYKEMQDSMDWSLQQTCNLKDKLNASESLLAAIKTALAISGTDDAKLGSLVRGLMEKRP